MPAFVTIQPVLRIIPTELWINLLPRWHRDGKRTLSAIFLGGFLLPVFAAFAQDAEPAEAAPESQPRLSANALDLCGKWAIQSNGSSMERTFEFFPDGRVTEVSTYISSRGETTETYDKLWKIEGDKVVIVPKGSDDPSSHSIFIDLPFDVSRLQISELWTSSSSRRQTKMVAVRVEAPPSRPTPVPPVQSATPPSSATSLSKLNVSVSPSAKNSSEGYYKIQRLSLNITLKNQSMRESTGLMSVSYWILGKSIRDSKQFCVFSKGKFDCSLGSSATDRELKRSTETYLNKYYVYSESFEYVGWIVAVSDPSGAVALVKASKPQWERLSDKLPTLEAYTAYDIQLDKIEGAYVPRYSY